ncbi:MAG: helix-turn-helix transcriptional regulator [Ruminococcaceae bacterium]|nr:helix-turn-helix transcriptional regulator [Oscillospiraceae bacterium]
MNIGNKIKELRKLRGITQEQLANSIGISFQAVSKWENGIALPDITLAPVLASYFGVSMDELFEFNLKEIKAAIDAIVNEAYKFRETDPQKSRAILEAGLKEYPDNDILLNNLLYVLNYSKNPDETVSIASFLIEKTNQVDIKYDALRFLAYAYKVKGDLKSAEAAIEQIPEIYFTKLTEMAYLLEGKPKCEAAEKQKWISFENLIQMMEKLAEYYESEGMKEKAYKEREKALRFIDLVENRAYDSYVKYFNNKIKNSI